MTWPAKHHISGRVMRDSGYLARKQTNRVSNRDNAERSSGKRIEWDIGVERSDRVCGIT